MQYYEMDCAGKSKNLDKMLQPGILTILSREKLHGFAIIQKLGENSMFDGTAPDKAGVYRYLKKMEESGMLVSEWDINEEGGVPRRIYAITDAGRKCLESWYHVLNQYTDSMKGLIRDMESVMK